MTTNLNPVEGNEPIEQTTGSQPEQKTVDNHQSSSMDVVYAFGLFGAWIYFISRANSVSEGLMGFVKGFVWPAILVYKLFAYFNEDAG